MSNRARPTGVGREQGGSADNVSPAVASDDAQDKSASTTEAALLAQAQSGSSSAFDQIITIHQENIARLVQRLLGWQSDVDDLVQDVFVDALKNLSRFDGRSSVLTWLTRLAINRARSYQRKQWIRKQLHLRLRDETTSLESPSANHSVFAKETIQQIHTAIRQLNHRDREVIVLRYLEELPVEQIATALNLTRGAVDVRLTRARQRLEKILAPILEK